MSARQQNTVERHSAALREADQAKLTTLDSFLAEARVYASFARDLARELAAGDVLSIEVADRLNDIVDAYRSIRAFVTVARAADRKGEKLPPVPVDAYEEIPPATPLGMQIARAINARSMLSPTHSRISRMEVFRGVDRHIVGLDPRRNEWECECSVYQTGGICEVMQTAYDVVLRPIGGKLRPTRQKLSRSEGTRA